VVSSEKVLMRKTAEHAGESRRTRREHDTGAIPVSLAPSMIQSASYSGVECGVTKEAVCSDSGS
jgi:hypothetical protein